MKKEDGGKVRELNQDLGEIELELTRNALEKSREELENAYDFINKAAEAGVIDIECDNCEDEIDPGLEDNENEEGEE